MVLVDASLFKFLDIRRFTVETVRHVTLIVPFSLELELAIQKRLLALIQDHDPQGPRLGRIGRGIDGSQGDVPPFGRDGRPPEGRVFSIVISVKLESRLVIGVQVSPIVRQVYPVFPEDPQHVRLGDPAGDMVSRAVIVLGE